MKKGMSEMRGRNIFHSYYFIVEGRKESDLMFDKQNISIIH